MKRADLLVGAGLGVLVFGLATGHAYDVIPLVLVAAVVGLALYLNRQPGPLTRAFDGGRRVQPGTGVRFDDVGGQETAKREMLEALDFLNHPDSARRLGIRPLKGILLTGPPGTGKTLLAKAAATYTDSVFLSTSGSEFVEMYAGVGAQRVRSLFGRARDLARSRSKGSAVIFLDEIEVLGGKRGRHASHLEYDQTLNQLLVEMDGLTWNDDVSIVVVAATNRPDLLDDALLRPGRFDRIVQVGLPDRAGRRQILELHCRDKPLAEDVDLDEIARETFGFSGAHLENLTNEAAILAWRQGSEVIRQDHLLEAIDKVILGEKAERRPSKAEKRRIAVHEAGHALVGELLIPGSVASITITSRGSALGYVRQRSGEDSFLQTQEELENQMAVALAGYCAERLVLGSPSTGATADFQQAARLAARMVAAGMSGLGVVDSEALPQRALYAETRRLTGRLRARVSGLLAEHRQALDRLTEELLEAESLPGERVRALLHDAAPAAPAG